MMEQGVHSSLRACNKDLESEQKKKFAWMIVSAVEAGIIVWLIILLLVNIG